MDVDPDADGWVVGKLQTSFKRYEARVRTSKKLVFIDRSGALRLEFETMSDLVGVVRATHFEDGFRMAMRYIYAN